VNATTEPVREALSLEGFTLIGDLLGDPLPPVRGGATTVEVAPESIRCLVLRRG
jgi:hypothetical protein